MQFFSFLCIKFQELIMNIYFNIRQINSRSYFIIQHILFHIINLLFFNKYYIQSFNCRTFHKKKIFIKQKEKENINNNTNNILYNK